MSGVSFDGGLDPLLRSSHPVPIRDSSKFSFRSDITITLPFWFVLVVCFAILLVVFLGFGLLYAVILAEPAIISIEKILSRTDILVKSMVASSVGAIANGNELIRSASLALVC
jgi:hypothetical protein